MIEALLSVVVHFFLWLVDLFNNVLIAPLVGLIVVLFPNVNDYLSDFNYFIGEYLLKGMAFVRELIFNITGYPRGLYHILIIFFFGRFALMGTLRLYMFLVNVLSSISGNWDRGAST